MGGRRKGRAECLFQAKDTDEQGDLYEAVIWKVPVSRRNQQGIRYRLAFIRSGETRPAVLYDNHHPKGHHRHLEPKTEPYEFRGIDGLLEDFRHDVQRAKGDKL